MDELQKRRERLSSPNSQIESIDENSFEHLSEQELENMKSDFLFEKQLARSLKVDVPDDLADRILLTQRTGSSSLRSYLKPSLSIAATITLVFGLVFDSSQQSLSSMALDHVYHELDHLVEQNTGIDLAVVEQKISSLGLKLSQLPSNIIYAGQCKLGNEQGYHLVAEINNRPVTILISPSQVTAIDDFEDNRFNGRVVPNGSSSLIFVGESIHDIDQMIAQTQSI
ncbi:MAG: DUF3379 domain-containing protein [Kangiellaceae bacterium]|nr:DUF3379 domain-containing protein [Kangiellaceae bacterium]